MKKTFVTRLLAVVICMAMLATVTPIFASAETTITEVTITDADITPILGEKKNDHLAYTLPEVAPYYKYNSGANYWHSSPSESGDTFVEGVTYSRFISLEAADGYLFDENTVITVNGTLFEGKFNVFWWVMDGGKYLTILMPGVKLSAETIDTIEINGFCDPVVGGKAGDFIHLTLPEDAPYHFDAGDPRWYNDTDDVGMDYYDAFEAGKSYSLGGWLIADKGYVFAENPTILLNGGEVAFDESFTKRDDTDTSCFYVWGESKEAVEKPADIEITEITITDADVTAYIGDKAGDHLDYTLPNDCHFTEDEHSWFNETTAHSMELNDIFENGPGYDLYWTFKAGDGYVFAEDAIVTINGQADIVETDWSRIDSENNTVFYVWTKPAKAVELTIIDTIEINGFCDPVAGGKAGDYTNLTLPEDAPYYFDYSFWYNDTDNHDLSSGDTFEAGKFYSLGGGLNADEGYVFAEDPEVLFNGGEYPVDESWTERDDTDEGYFYVWSEPKEAVEPIVIDTIEITDVDLLPIIGDKTNDHIDYAFPENCHFTATEHGWYDKTDEEWVDDDDDTFVAGHTYQVGWWLAADEGYTFAEDPTITINGEENINWEDTYINEKDSTLFSVWTNPTEAVEKPEPIETTVDLRIGDKEFYGVKGGETLVVESLDAMQDITVLVQNGVDIEGMSNDWSMSTKFLDGEGRGVLEVQVFEEGDDYVTFNLQSHYADCPGASVDDFQIMMITVKVEASAEKLLGDANDDGAVNMKDVLLMRKYLAGLDVEYNAENADCNGDGDVNMKDVLMLRKYLAGLVETLGA